MVISINTLNQLFVGKNVLVTGGEGSDITGTCEAVTSADGDMLNFKITDFGYVGIVPESIHGDRLEGPAATWLTYRRSITVCD